MDAFPHEYPGMIYAFNWALNGDGVTPLRGSAFRINKTLDLKVAGLSIPKVQPLQVNDPDSEYFWKLVCDCDFHLHFD